MKKHWLLLGGIVAIFFALQGCKKDPQKLGFGVQPDSDLINVFTTDTASVVSYSQRIDSISSSNAPLTLFGSLKDPVFGITTAAFSTSFRLVSVAHSFGDNPGVDSLILSLRFTDVYGDSLESQTMKVYELTQQLQDDTTYYSNSEVSHSSTLLANHTFVPDFTDSVVIKGDSLAPHVRVDLTQLTTELSDKLLSATEDQMASNDDFSEFFHGLRIEAEKVTVGGSIISFDLLDELSNLTIYYHNDEEDSLSFEYAITSNSIRFGNFYQDYDVAGTDLRAQVFEGDTALGQEVVYVQPMAGIRTVVHFPHIKEFFKGQVISINEAKLVLDGLEEMTEFQPPAGIIAARFNGDGTITALSEQFEGKDFYGGYYVEDENQYWFRITSYIQDLMREDVVDYGLDIFVDGGAYNPGRFIFAGPQPEDASSGPRLRLEIKYTRL